MACTGSNPNSGPNAISDREQHTNETYIKRMFPVLHNRHQQTLSTIGVSLRLVVAHAT